MRLVILIFLPILSSCITASYNDSIWCASSNLSQGGTCVHFLTTATEEKSSTDYIQWLVGSDPDDKGGPKVCTSAATLAAWKANLEKECDAHPNSCAFNASVIDGINSVQSLNPDGKMRLIVSPGNK